MPFKQAGTLNVSKNPNKFFRSLAKEEPVEPAKAAEPRNAPDTKLFQATSSHFSRSVAGQATEKRIGISTQFFSQCSLRELLGRLRFCHKTFRDCGKNSLLREPRLRKMVALLFGKELRQIAPETRLSCFSTIEMHERLWVKRRKELRQTTVTTFLRNPLVKPNENISRTSRFA